MLTKLGVGSAAALILVVGLVPSAWSANFASPTFTQLGLSAVVSGFEVTATALVGATAPKAVQSFGICVRDAGNANVDYPKLASATITPSGTTISRTKSFSSGTYSYFPCLYADGSWHNVGDPKGFVVGSTPSPSPLPTTSTVPTTWTPPPSTSAAPTTSTPPTTPASGVRTIFVDNFSGALNSLPDSTKWSYQVGGSGWGNGELEYYKYADPDNSSMDGNGHLRIVVRSESFGGRSYTSARLRTMGKFDFLYGTMEARIRIPAGSGLWPAFWTQGTKDNAGTQDNWPVMGEIDVMEAVNSDKGYAAAVHGGPSHWSKYKWNAAPPRDNAFHTYTAKWTPGAIAFYIDGVLMTTVNKSQTPSGQSWPFDSARQYLLLNVAMGGSYPGSPSGTASLPATMLVDYVKVTQ